MARITVEDCLTRENNRFALIHLSSKRTKQLLAGAEPLTDIRNNKAVVASLREIAAGKVRFMTPEEIEQEREARAAARAQAEAEALEQAKSSPANGSIIGDSSEQAKAEAAALAEDLFSGSQSGLQADDKEGDSAQEEDKTGDEKDEDSEKE